MRRAQSPTLLPGHVGVGPPPTAHTGVRYRELLGRPALALEESLIAGPDRGAGDICVRGCRRRRQCGRNAGRDAGAFFIFIFKK